MWMGRHFLSLGTVPQEYFLCFPLPTLAGLATTGEGSLRPLRFRQLRGTELSRDHAVWFRLQGHLPEVVEGRERWGQVVAAQVAE